MKKEVRLFATNEEVMFEESEARPVLLNNGDRYDEAVITDDGRLIAYDEAISDWVQLGLEGDQGYTFV